MPKEKTQEPVVTSGQTAFQKMLDKVPNKQCCMYCEHVGGDANRKTNCPFNKYKALSMSYITEFPSSDWKHDVDFCSKFEEKNVSTD